MSAKEQIIFCYKADEFQRAYRQFGNERGVWLVWIDRGGVEVE